jgi:hypothetical protein
MLGSESNRCYPFQMASFNMSIVTSSLSGWPVQRGHSGMEIVPDPIYVLVKQVLHALFDWRLDHQTDMMRPIHSPHDLGVHISRRVGVFLSGEGDD